MRELKSHYLPAEALQRPDPVATCSGVPTSTCSSKLLPAQVCLLTASIKHSAAARIGCLRASTPARVSPTRSDGFIVTWWERCYHGDQVSQEGTGQVL